MFIKDASYFLLDAVPKKNMHDGIPALPYLLKSSPHITCSPIETNSLPNLSSKTLRLILRILLLRAQEWLALKPTLLRQPKYS